MKTYILLICKVTIIGYHKVILKRILGGCSGGGPGIRTLGGVNLAGFQDRYIRPTLSILHVSVNNKKSGGATRI